VSIKTSGAAIDNSVYISMASLSLGTWNSTLCNGKERIICSFVGIGFRNRLQPSGRSASMGKEESLAFGDAAQNAFGVPSELKHGDGLHLFNFKLKFNSMQEN
jgi:hypothetical protein